jgi:hypothetical protein
MFSTCSGHVQYMSSACSVQVQYIFSACSVHVQCMISTCSVHVKCMLSTCSVHVQCIFSTCSVHDVTYQRLKLCGNDILYNNCYLNHNSFIPQSVLLQFHSLLQSQFYTQCDLVLPLSISNILSFF